jgi:hypothetical protein
MMKNRADFECEYCYKQGPDVKPVVDPYLLVKGLREESYLCADCLAKQQMKADYVTEEERKREIK